MNLPAPSSTPVGAILSRLKVPHHEFRHEGPVRTLEQAASERNQAQSQVVRSLLFRIGEGAFVMVLIAGPSQVSWPKLRRTLGLSRLTTATSEEMQSATGYVRGAVSPFGIDPGVRILVDTSVLQEAEISIGSGERGKAVILSTQDLMSNLANPAIVSVAVGR